MSNIFRVPATKAEADPRRWPALIVLLLASFMNLIDITIVNVALPGLQQSMSADPSQLEWVIAAYALAFALGLLPFGRLGDIVGRTKMFLIGTGLFTLASALCGLAPNIEMLVMARALQGLAAAAMTPQALAIATVTFPPEEKGLAISLFGLSAGLAAVTGPIAGGLLIGADLWDLDWRPIFLVNVPIGVLAAIAGLMLIPRTPGHPDLKNDYAGVLLFGAAIVALVFPLIEGRSYGWPLWAWAMMAAALALAAIFVWWERGMAAANRPQLLNFGLISNGSFRLGMLITAIFFSGIPAMFMVLSLLLQAGYGLTPLMAGLIYTPFSIGVLVISAVSSRFGQKHLRTRLAVGAGLLVVGMSWLHLIVAGLGETIDLWSFLPPMLVAGLGLGFSFTSLFQTVLMSVPSRDAGAGSGALQAFQQIGGAIGVALVGEIFFTNLAENFGADSGPHAAFASSTSLALIYQIVSFGAVVLLVPFIRIKRSDQAQDGIPTSVLPAPAEP